MNAELYLRCKVRCGQFTGEYAVSGRDSQGTDFSLFASEPDVQPSSQLFEQGQEVDGLLRVTLLDRRENLLLVRMPSQTFENGCVIVVTADQVSGCCSHECV